MKKRKIYTVIDCFEPRHQNVYGSKTRLLEAFFESECGYYFETIDNKIGDRDEKCHNCKKDIDTIDSNLEYYNDFMSCIDCDLFYCVRCVKKCSNCNNKLLSRDETGEWFKNKIKENFEKDGPQSLEKYYYNCFVEVDEIEFSDDELEEENIKL